MDHRPPSVSLISTALDRAGRHPYVDMIVDRVERRDGAIDIALVLKYDSEHPVCCAEPACYIPALRSKGLASISHQIQVEEFLDKPPTLTIEVRLSLGHGFQFLRPEIGAPDGTRLLYYHSES